MQHINTKSKTFIFRLGGSLAALSFVFIFAALSFVPREAEAINSDFGVDIESAIALSLDTSYLILDAANVSGETSTSGELNVTVNTNNITGYTLLMSSKTEDAALTHTNGADKILSTSNTTAGALAVNTWGYNLNSSTVNFLKVPTVSSPTNIADS